jgi:hypothetical protein
MRVICQNPGKCPILKRSDCVCKHGHYHELSDACYEQARVIKYTGSMTQPITCVPGCKIGSIYDMMKERLNADEMSVL